ncbi:hypothetical protein GCM10011452_09200 [Gemmobacter lanyuensis]|uniref:HK97 gp10 family phage protein n=1 Tax=Gemmobacter lanyuensis TaxID=1054497 RepID=A0A918MH77_9RHOB|nr:HK97-gp10 family putative phage morphogenesis protein [Gemmobacter lanyuensis]GGW23985.1 hypothetical protein GCM10011452_09200 [Gemmobacter lanyuensis]
MVQGLNELNRRWTAIPKKVRDAVRVEMEKAADDVVATMRRFAPVDTGALRESIGWTWGDAPAGALTIGKVGKTEYGTMLITIYAGGTEQTKRRQARASGTRARDQKRGGYFDTDVARLQEFGTKVMNAHPFFFPAWRAKRTKVKGNISRAITRAIKSA